MDRDFIEFLRDNRISQETWDQSNCDWSQLVSIKSDYIAHLPMLRAAASFCVDVIQSISSVHSVRSRLKDPDHLIAKIVRKRFSGEEKYQDICLENYSEKITDLVGIRALHLFKEDCFDIADELLRVWTPVENPIAYIRSGDKGGLIRKLEESSMEVKEHPKGYRSLHCIFSSQPAGRKVFFEVQVRTIFEEGWSEIDHTVRYPNFSENELVGLFLAIFNRLAGSADEMGEFVKDLASSLHDQQEQINVVKREKDESLGKIDALINQLESYKKQDKELRGTVDKLKSEVLKIRNESSLEDHLTIAKTFINALDSDNKKTIRPAVPLLGDYLKQVVEHMRIENSGDKNEA